MKTTSLTQIEHCKQNPNATPESIQQFYDEATEDYTFWSKDFNMHFGYYSYGRTNPLRRDTMLNEMNRQIMLRLKLPDSPAMVADLGCGMGGTMRYMMERNPSLSMMGVARRIPIPPSIPMATSLIWTIYSAVVIQSPM